MAKYLLVFIALHSLQLSAQTNFAPIIYGSGTYNPQEIFFGGPRETYHLGNCAIRGSINEEIYWTGYCYTPNNLYGGASPLMANTFVVGKNGTIWKNEACEIFGSWHQQVSGTLDTLFSVKFFSIDTGFIAGENGRILRTFNNGRNWTSMPSGVSQTLRRIIYTPDRTLFAVGDNGILIRSTDHAVSWNIIPTGTAERLTDISFAGNDTGYISGYNGLLLKSLDAGLTWTPLNSGTTSRINAVDFVSGLKGFTGSDSLRMTTDGGLTWNPYHLYLYTSIIDVKFRDALNGYFVTSDKHFRTYDGGAEWHDMGQDLQTVEFPSQLTGYAAGTNVLRKTIDGGFTWTQIHPFAGATIYDAFFLNNDTGYVSGTSGSIYKTTDGGTTWSKQVTNTNALLRSIHFFNANDGIAVGSNWTTARTSDGGLNWTLTSFPNPSVYGYHDIYFLDNNLGYRCGSQGSIQKTTDGGATFTTLTSGTTDYLLKIYFIDMLKGFAIGEDGLLLRTINGGVSWSQYNLPSTGFLNAIAFSDSLNGFIAGESGIFFQTEDGGATWEYKSFNVGNIYDITFSDPYHGYLVGSADYRAMYVPVKGLNAYADACASTGIIYTQIAANVQIDSGNVFILELDSTGSDFTDAITLGAVQSDTSGAYLYFRIPDDLKAGMYSSRLVATKTSPVSESITTTVNVRRSPEVTVTLLNDTLYTEYNPEYLYQWYNGFNMISGANFSFLPLDSSGSYRVVVKHGCCSDGIAYLTVSDCNGSYVAAPVTSDQFICDSAAAVLTASGAQQYHWYDSDTGSTVLSTDSFYVTPAITSAETYYVTSVYAGCESDRIPVRVYIVSPPQLPVVNPVTACANEGVYLFSSGVPLNWYTDTNSTPVKTGSNYYYHPNAADPIFVTASNYSCETEFVSVSVNLIAPPVAQTISGDTAVAPFSIAMYNYPNVSGNILQWNVTGGTFVQHTDSIEVNWGNSGTGTVSVIETNQSDCSSETTLVVDINITHGVEEEVDGRFTVYPNPSTGLLYINNIGKEPASFLLFDPLLKMVVEKDLKGNSTNRLAIDGLPSGIYLYNIKVNNEIFDSGKIILLDTN